MLQRSGFCYRFVRFSFFLLFTGYTCTIWAQTQFPTSTQTQLHFPQPVTGGHVVFGLPINGAESPRHVGVYDPSGTYIQADVFPLQSWQGSPDKWALIAFPALSEDTLSKTFTIRFDKANPIQEEGITTTEEADGSITLSNFFYSIKLSASGIEAIGTTSSQPSPCSFRPGFLPSVEQDIALSTQAGKLEYLYNGSLYKKIRIRQDIQPGLEAIQEFDFFANSPYVKAQVRFVNSGSDDLALAGLLPLHANLRDARGQQLGLTSGSSTETGNFSIHQGYYDWLAALDGTDNLRGKSGTLEGWFACELDNGVPIQFVLPYFQEMAVQSPDRESIFSFKQDILKVHHFKPISGSPTSKLTLASGRSRSFTYWMVINPLEKDWMKHAEVSKAMPYVSYERPYMSLSEVLPEGSAGTHLDALAKSYTDRLSSRHIPKLDHPIPTNFPLQGLDFGWNQGAQDLLGLSSGGTDISLSLIQHYLRFGEQEVGQAAYLYALLQADAGVNRNTYSNLASSHPASIDAVEGMLAAYQTWGEPWFWESAQLISQKSAGNSVRSGGDAEVLPVADFTQRALYVRNASPSESDFNAQVRYAHAQTLAFLGNKTPTTFYLANAAWLGLIEGGEQAQKEINGLLMAQGLPLLAGLAAAENLPYIVEIRGEEPNTLSQTRMAPAASWDGKLFSFALQRNPLREEVNPSHKGALDVVVYMPFQKVNMVKVGGDKVDFQFSAPTKSLTFALPATSQMKTYRIEVSAR